MEKMKITQVGHNTISHRDVVLHTTDSKFSFRGRVKILFGCSVRVNSEIFTLNERVDVVGSRATACVLRLFPKNNVGGGICVWVPKNKEA